MNDEILRHYGLTEPFAETWQDIDTSSPTHSFNATESDALGTGQSVSTVLYERGVIRSEKGVSAEYSIDSKSFDARQYIRNVHRKATQNDLKRGQDYLNTAIESKSGSLKVLVEDNFDRFVGSKRVIDNVHAQIASDFSKSGSSTTESRMDKIRGALNDTSIKAAQVFEPVIESRRKADKLRSTLGILEQYSAHFDLPSVLLQHIEGNDYEGLLKEYKKGQAMFADVAKVNGTAGTTERRNARILSRVKHEVDRIMRTQELHIWKSLNEQRQVDFEATSKLANFLLELGVDSNPYFRAYTQHNIRIKDVAIEHLARNRTQVEILRRKLQIRQISSKRARLEALSAFIETEISPSETTPNILQTQEILGFWDSIKQLVNDVWSKQASAMAVNWRIVQEMTNPRSVTLLPNGPDGVSRKFHSFTAQEKEAAIAKAEETIEVLCNSLTDFFISKPIRELPALYSQTSVSASTEEVPNLPDVGDRPPAEFSFVPVSVNSLGTCLHLGAIMQSTLTGVNKLHALKISAKSDEQLSKMTAAIRERMIRSICELWQADSDDLPFLESWKVNSTINGTDFPRTLWTVQKAIIDGIARIMYKNDLIPTPSQRLLGNIRQQFVKNIYQVINGLMTLSYSPVPPILLPHNTIRTEKEEVEVRKLLTMANLQTITSSTLLKLIQIMESTFSISLTPDIGKINSMFAQYSTKLTSSILSPRMQIIEKAIGKEYSDINMSTNTPMDVSFWTNEVVLESIATHALLMKFSPSLLKTCLDPLITHIFSTVLSILQSFEKMDKGGVLQVTVDMEFVMMQFSDALPIRARTIRDEIFALVNQKKGSHDIDAAEKEQVKRILTRAARRWSTHAQVFSN